MLIMKVLLCNHVARLVNIAALIYRAMVFNLFLIRRHLSICLGFRFENRRGSVKQSAIYM